LLVRVLDDVQDVPSLDLENGLFEGYTLRRSAREPALVPCPAPVGESPLVATLHARSQLFSGIFGSFQSIE